MFNFNYLYFKKFYFNSLFFPLESQLLYELKFFEIVNLKQLKAATMCSF